VAGIRKDGTPQLSPNWFYWDGERFYISITRTRAKYAIFRRDPRVTLAIDDSTAFRAVVVRGTVERFSPSLFLRDTLLTQADQRIGDFARDIREAKKGDVLAELHSLLDRLHQEMEGEDETSQTEAATAAEVFQRKRGVARDLAHIFVGAARSLSIPARFVAGYLCIDGVEQRSGHAWAEAYVPKLGWIGFDPVKGVCPTEAYIRVAVGLDALGAIPIRGAHYGGGTEKLAVAIEVNQ